MRLILFCFILFVGFFFGCSNCHGQEQVDTPALCNVYGDYICYAEEMPIFLGNKTSFLNSLKKKLAPILLDTNDSDELYLTVGFIVTCRGSVSKVNVFNDAYRDSQAFATITRMLRNTLWKPALKNGKPSNVVNYLVASFKNGRIYSVFL